MHIATTIAVTLLTAHAAKYVHARMRTYARSKKPAREYYVSHSRPVQVEQTADAASPGEKSQTLVDFQSLDAGCVCVCVDAASDQRFCLTGVHGQKGHHRPKKQLKSPKSNKYTLGQTSARKEAELLVGFRKSHFNLWSYFACTLNFNHAVFPGPITGRVEIHLSGPLGLQICLAFPSFRLSTRALALFLLAYQNF